MEKKNLIRRVQGLFGVSFPPDWIYVFIALCSMVTSISSIFFSFNDYFMHFRHSGFICFFLHLVCSFSHHLCEFYFWIYRTFTMLPKFKLYKVMYSEEYYYPSFLLLPWQVNDFIVYVNGSMFPYAKIIIFFYIFLFLFLFYTKDTTIGTLFTFFFFTKSH